MIYRYQHSFVSSFICRSRLVVWSKRPYTTHWLASIFDSIQQANVFATKPRPITAVIKYRRIAPRAIWRRLASIPSLRKARQGSNDVSPRQRCLKVTSARLVTSTKVQKGSSFSLPLVPRMCSVPPSPSPPSSPLVHTGNSWKTITLSLTLNFPR